MFRFSRCPPLAINIDSMKNQSAPALKNEQSIKTRHPILKRIRAQPRKRIRELLSTFVTFDLSGDARRQAQNKT